jgi:hypothetical protein
VNRLEKVDVVSFYFFGDDQGVEKLPKINSLNRSGFYLGSILEQLTDGAIAATAIHRDSSTSPKHHSHQRI